MKISILGLGYVGCVTAACLAHRGHTVIGVDVNPDKVDMINRGQSPVIERGLDEMIQQAVQAGSLFATQDVGMALTQSDICMVCVGTPSDSNGGVNLEYVQRVCVEIGRALATAPGYKLVVFRSTILPDVLRSQLIPLIAFESGKQAGTEFGVAVNPEFLREGNALADFEQPPMTLIGEMDERPGDILAALYADIPAPLFRTDLDIAYMVKYAANAFHALKVAFANEIGRLCKRLGLDSVEVMHIFCQDTRLNISPNYLKPGFAFGGSCLPKDLRALLYLARHNDVDLPVLEAVLPSNLLQVSLALEAVQRTGKDRVAILGLSFKPNTDDLRESPAVLLAENLIGKGYQVRVYDRNVSLSRLMGGNRSYIEQTIPHLAALTCNTLQEAVDSADVIVATHGLVDGLRDLVRAEQVVVDLHRIGNGDHWKHEVAYEGLCW